MFLNCFEFFNLFVTSVLGWGYAPIWEMGVSMALYGNTATPQVFGVHEMSPSLLLPYISF
jgi:hypothetical protein